jgi:hypothetical protein
MGSIFGAGKAADAAKDSAKDARRFQMMMFDKSMAMLKPYIDFGQEGMSRFTNALGDLTKQFNPTMDQLEQTPGYQFALQQGLKATQNKYAAGGLGVSGAAMKGATDYAEGLAGQTYQQAFQNDLAQKSQEYNMLYNPVQLGANAAAGAAGQAMQTGTNLANIQMNRGSQLGQIYGAQGAGIDNLLGAGLGLLGGGSNSIFGKLVGL